MKILQLNSAKTFGGGEKHFVDLARGLQQRGQQVYFAVRQNCEWENRLYFLDNQQVLRLPLRNSADLISVFKLAKFIRQNRIDIVHAHPARDYVIASLAVRLAKRAKLILTRHVLFPVKSSRLLGNVSKIIAVSSGVEETLKLSFPNEKIVVIPNGIEIKADSELERKEMRQAFRFEHNISFDAFVVGTIGELKELKGQRDFVLAAKIIAEKIPEAFFVIVGKDNSRLQNFRTELKRLVKVFGLENRFLWLDWVENTATVLRALDVFVSPSHSESFGLAIVEAMVEKVPIVASQTAGAKEILRHRESGLLVPVHDPVVLAEEICRLKKDENLGLALAEKARREALEKFNLEKMIEATEKVYRSLFS